MRVLPIIIPVVSPVTGTIRLDHPLEIVAFVLLFLVAEVILIDAAITAWRWRERLMSVIAVLVALSMAMLMVGAFIG